MKVPFVDLHGQYLGIKDEIDSAIAEVIAQSAFIRGEHVDAFEQAWAETLKVKHCVSCANGTDALYIAMRGLGVKTGDEVITTAHSWIATSETITQAGGRVVFCDTQKDTFNIDPRLIEAKIAKATVGIIPVHLCGQPADMDEIMAIAKKHNLWVIEDCAQAHLATYKGRPVGTFGNAATFSFYPGKNLGAYGDAGCIVTNDDALADWAATFARHGGKGEHVMEGINSRVAARYNELLSGIDNFATPKVADDRSHVYHLYVVATDKRDSLKKTLADSEITTSLNYPKALPFYPAYAYLGHKPADFPVAYHNQSRILSLPIFPEMTDEMIEYVVDNTKRALTGLSIARATAAKL